MKNRHQTNSAKLTSFHTHALARQGWWWNLRCGCKPSEQIIPFFSSHRGCAMALKSNQVIVPAETALAALNTPPLTQSEIASLDAAMRARCGQFSEWHPATLADAIREIETTRNAQHA